MRLYWLSCGGLLLKQWEACALAKKLTAWYLDKWKIVVVRGACDPASITSSASYQSYRRPARQLSQKRILHQKASATLVKSTVAGNRMAGKTNDAAAQYLR